MIVNKHITSIIIIIIIAFGVYFNSLPNEFIWDDNHLIKDNVYIKNWSHLGRVFTENIGAGVGINYYFYRPAQILTYALDYRLWKFNVIGYHLTNILWHLLAALCLYWLVFILFHNLLLSFFTSLLFVVHPIQTEAVTYISGRADPLALTFLLLSFILYLKFCRRQRLLTFILLAGAYLAALLARENSMILPLLIILYHYTFRKKINRAGLLFFIIADIAYIAIRFTLLADLLPHSASATTFGQRLPGFFSAIAQYLKLLILPFPLHMEYGIKLFHFTDATVIIGIIVTLLLLGYTVTQRSRHQLFFFASCWFFICLMPVSNLYPINAYMSEHWLYLPAIGFYLLLARFLTGLWQRKKRILPLTVTLLIIIYYSALTIRQNTYWRKPIAFYERTLKYAPTSYRLLNNLGAAYKNNGQDKTAAYFYRQSIEQNPENANAYRNLGLIQKDDQQFEQAIALYQKAIELNPYYTDAYNNLGAAYKENGQINAAISCFQKAIEMTPRHPDAYFNLANTLRINGNYKQALNLYQQALELNPRDTEIYNNLAITYAKSGKIEQALSCLQKMISINPQLAGTYINMGNLYYQLGKIKNAISCYEQAIAVDADNALAHYNLAEVYYREKEYNKARKYTLQARDLGMEHPLLKE